MKKRLVILAVLVLLPALPAHADTFRMGSTYNAISIDFNGVLETWYGTVGGGSYDVAQLNGVNVPWVYCVDLEHTINLNTTYSNTTVTTSGVVNGSEVTNAGQVAWLLDQYASAAAGNGGLEAALQAAIWEVIYGDSFTLLNTSVTSGYYSTSLAYVQASQNRTAPVSNYLWLTPGGTNSVQGLVTAVPEPGSMLLLGVGLFGLAWAARRRRHGA